MVLISRLYFYPFLSFNLSPFSATCFSLVILRIMEKCANSGFWNLAWRSYTHDVRIRARARVCARACVRACVRACALSSLVKL